MLILVTEQKKKHIATVQGLIANGIYSFVCPYETAGVLCEAKDTGGVVLDCIANLPRAERLCAELRARYPEMPIAAIVAPGSIPNLAVNRLIRTENPREAFDDVLDFCIRTCGWNTKILSTFSLRVGETPDQTLYMGYPLPLTVREHSILRCLFYRAPYVTSKSDLMELCYPEGTQGLENVVVQIQKINQKAAEIDRRPLIVNVYGKGYLLRDGILR